MRCASWVLSWAVPAQSGGVRAVWGPGVVSVSWDELLAQLQASSPRRHASFLSLSPLVSL